MKKNILEWINDYRADVVCLQEIKAKEDQIDIETINETGYKFISNPAERPGYSGTANLYLKEPKAITKGMGEEKFDNEGRLIRFSYPDFELFNIYFPNGSKDNVRVPYKLDFYAYLLDLCDQMQKEGKEIIITGDFNTAHKEIDLKNPKANEKNTGFLPEEREWIDRYLEHGFYDAYRKTLSGRSWLYVVDLPVQRPSEKYWMAFGLLFGNQRYYGTHQRCCYSFRYHGVRPLPCDHNP